jgi:hypothetical protein
MNHFIYFTDKTLFVFLRFFSSPAFFSCISRSGFFFLVLHEVCTLLFFMEWVTIKLHEVGTSLWISKYVPYSWTPWRLYFTDWVLLSSYKIGYFLLIRAMSTFFISRNIYVYSCVLYSAHILIIRVLCIACISWLVHILSFVGWAYLLLRRLCIACTSWVEDILYYLGCA